MMRMHDGMTLATGNEPAIDRECRHAGDGQRHQKCGDSTVASMAPGTASMIALSTTSMTVIEAASAANATRSAAGHE